MLHVIYPQYQLLFLFDHSTCQGAYADDALRESWMNKGWGGTKNGDEVVNTHTLIYIGVTAVSNENISRTTPLQIAVAGSQTASKELEESFYRPRQVLF